MIITYKVKTIMSDMRSSYSKSKLQGVCVDFYGYKKYYAGDFYILKELIVPPALQMVVL